MEKSKRGPDKLFDDSQTTPMAKKMKRQLQEEARSRSISASQIVRELIAEHQAQS